MNRDETRDKMQGDPNFIPFVGVVSAENRYLIERFSRLVGRVLSAAEIALPEGKQCDALKKALETAVYDTRNELMAHFGSK